jgi:hypothetical protein
VERLRDLLDLLLGDGAGVAEDLELVGVRAVGEPDRPGVERLPLLLPGLLQLLGGRDGGDEARVLGIDSIL